MSKTETSEWDKLTTDDIRSTASDELHETRPNRWTGPGSTWRKLTARDRETHAALESVRNRDLGVHLYNAFALRRGGYAGEEDGNDEDARKGERWGPDKVWTAWPLGLDRVPKADFVGKGEDDEGTFRRPASRDDVGCELEAEVSATMLRIAREKFRQRDFGERKQPVVIPSVETAGGEDADISLSQIKAEPQSGVEEDNDDEEEERAVVEKMESDSLPEPGMLPTVSIDDDLSYEILRPVTRHVLAKLDQTLTVLHNARVAGIDFGSDSGESEEEGASETAEPAKRSPKRKIWQGEDDESETAATPAKPTTRRIDLHTPGEGETDREMQVRLARKYHRRIPRFSDDEEEEGGGDTTAADAAGSSKTPGRRRKKVRVTTRSMAREPAEKPGPHGRRGSRLGRWALRDWSDVLGAAALAGFSPCVIARATQRCADLFGQGMEFNTLAEEPLTAGRMANKRRSRKTRFTPGEQTLPTSDEEYDEEEEGYRSEAEQIRAVSRASSVILDGSSSEENDDESAATTPRRRSQQRSYSVNPSVVRLYCPHASCSGAINGFARRYNLKKHLALVHGKTGGAEALLSEDEDDNPEEVHGAVHVDGFLRPIRPRKGWRAGDTQASAGRRQLRKGYRKTRGTPPPSSRQMYSEDVGYYAEVGEGDMMRDADDGNYI